MYLVFSLLEMYKLVPSLLAGLGEPLVAGGECGNR